MVLKKKSTAYLIWVFLSGFGAHRFYVGKKRSGLAIPAYIVLTALFEYFIVVLFPSLSVDFQNQLYWFFTVPFWLFLLRDGFCISGWIDKYNTKSLKEKELRELHD